MPTRKLQHEPQVSQTQRALAIYRDHLKMVEQGKHDKTRSWRQAVLASFAQSLDVATTTRATLYSVCQKREGLKVNDNFEIVRFDGTKVFPSASGKRAAATKAALAAPVQMTTHPASTTPLPKKRGRPPKSTTATAVVSAGTAPARRAAPAPPPALGAAPLSAPAAPTSKTNSPAKQRAEKAYADLIALCEGEIADAFQTLEELIDNVDQFGDAATLKKFTRQVKAACRQIDQQLGTKALLDKKQANKILPGLK